MAWDLSTIFVLCLNRIDTDACSICTAILIPSLWGCKGQVPYYAYFDISFLLSNYMNASSCPPLDGWDIIAAEDIEPLWESELIDLEDAYVSAGYYVYLYDD